MLSLSTECFCLQFVTLSLQLFCKKQKLNHRVRLSCLFFIHPCYASSNQPFNIFDLCKYFFVGIRTPASPCIVSMITHAVRSEIWVISTSSLNSMNFTSGIFLVLAYPSKAFTNPDFYIKLTLIGFAIWTLMRIKRQVFDDSSVSEAAMFARGKTLAVWSLVLWLGVITTGRLLAYTCSYLVYGVPC